MSRAHVEAVALAADNWERWRALRLAALADAPEAFGSTLAQWTGAGDTEARWRGRFAAVPHNLVLVRDGHDAGMVSLLGPDEEGFVELVSMWVAPPDRGFGVGDAAVGAVLRLAAEHHPGWPVSLAVRVHNEPAQSLYRRHGFVDAGPAPDGPHERRMRLRQPPRLEDTPEPAREAHAGPVPEDAWAQDAAARDRGRVEIFNATRPGGLDGWTMDGRQYALARAHLLAEVDAGPPEGVPLSAVVAAAQEQYSTHPAFPTGRTRNYWTYTKVDLEARCELERSVGSGPQRVCRWRP